MGVNAAYTSTRQIPAFISQWVPERGSVILDFGGGRFDDATGFLDATHGCTNLVYDPFNRSEAHNAAVESTTKHTGCDYIICLNVLNVVQNKEERREIVSKILEFTSTRTREIIFQIYEGDCSGITSTNTAQMNTKTQVYVPEISEVFNASTGWEVKQFRIGSKNNGIRVKKII